MFLPFVRQGCLVYSLVGVVNNSCIVTCRSVILLILPTLYVQNSYSNLKASYENRILMNWCIAAKIGKWTY